MHATVGNFLISWLFWNASNLVVIKCSVAQSRIVAFPQKEISGISLASQYICFPSKQKLKEARTTNFPKGNFKFLNYSFRVHVTFKMRIKLQLIKKLFFFFFRGHEPHCSYWHVQVRFLSACRPDREAQRCSWLSLLASSQCSGTPRWAHRERPWLAASQVVRARSLEGLTALSYYSLIFYLMYYFPCFFSSR